MVSESFDMRPNGKSLASRERDLERLYRALRKLEHGLGGKRLMSECTGRQDWPQRGIYFFFEPGECRTSGGTLRVVRIGAVGVGEGTNATLWDRLRTHRGTTEGAGDHRSSVFRRHVGAALLLRQPSLDVPSWLARRKAVPLDIRKNEEQLERAVSAHIGKMSILWLSILDEAGPASDRAYLEKNLIGLLAGTSRLIERSSPQWLGLSSPFDGVKNSGLWNLDHLDNGYSPDSLGVLEKYVSIALGREAF